MFMCMKLREVLLNQLEHVTQFQINLVKLMTVQMKIVLANGFKIMDFIEFKKFFEEESKIEHSIKSALGRINKTIQNVNEFIERMKNE